MIVFLSWYSRLLGVFFSYVRLHAPIVAFAACMNLVAQPVGSGTFLVMLLYHPQRHWSLQSIKIYDSLLKKEEENTLARENHMKDAMLPCAFLGQLSIIEL
jgi:hypothetical protein